MGRIKSLMVKRAAKQLLVGEHQFDETFTKNKRILGFTMPSKSVRNKIAGYMAHLLKMKRLSVEREARILAKKEALATQLAEKTQAEEFAVQWLSFSNKSINLILNSLHIVPYAKHFLHSFPIVIKRDALEYNPQNSNNAQRLQP